MIIIDNYFRQRPAFTITDVYIRRSALYLSESPAHARPKTYSFYVPGRHDMELTTYVPLSKATVIQPHESRLFQNFHNI